MLAYYAERLNGVELNGTFYRSPGEASLRAWSDAPEGFVFCLKGHRALTYSAAAFPKEQVAADLTRRIALLEGRLGPLLLQFPPVRTRDLTLLRSLLTALGRPVAAEFRHESWFDGEVADLLREHGSGQVVTDSDEWPVAPAGEFSFAYYRLRRDYDQAALTGWAERIRADLARGREVHAYFRHDAQGPLRAVELRRLVGEG
jgi:uncharacterized protein YecE (DUF72 family)